MRKGLMYKSIILIMVCMYILFTHGLSSYAQSAVHIRIPVQQVLEESEKLSGEKKFEYILESEEPETPMPEGSSEKSYTFSLEGNTQSDLLIEMNNVGIYSYKLKQSNVSEKKEWLTDERVYDIEVYVKNGQDNELTPVVIIKNNENDKPERAVFVNRYIPAVSEQTVEMDQSKNIHAKDKIQTGDKSSVTVLCLAAVVSLILMIGLVVRYMKHKRK